MIDEVTTVNLINLFLYFTPILMSAVVMYKTILIKRKKIFITHTQHDTLTVT